MKLWFIKLSTSELAIERVKSRVKQGRHDIPHATILRRFTSGLKNLEKFKLIVDSWVIFDGDVDIPKIPRVKMLKMLAISTRSKR